MIRPFCLVALIALTAACNRGGETNNLAASAPPNAALPVNTQANGQASSQPGTSQPGTEAAWQTTPSGLKYRRIRGEGSGAKPGPTDSVTIHYVGSLTDGTVFDSSVENGAPVTMALPDLIPGWQEGVPLMSVGDVYEFEVPPALGYGPQGIGPIPPNATLRFTIGLLGIGS